MMSVPSILIFLSLVLAPKVNRVVHILFGFIYTIIMVLVVSNSIDAWHSFYVYLGILEMLITLLIVWTAWRWPKQPQPVLS